MKIFGFRNMALAAVTTGLVLFGTTPATAAPNPNLWCWSMQSGALKGTFTMNPVTPGNGSAPQGTYTLTAFSLTASSISGVDTGSTSNGVYAFGSQPDYTIVWDGSQPTSWNRQNGLYTNGIGIESGPQGSTTYLVFNTNYQLVEDHAVNYVFATVTPFLSPADSNGLCPWESAPSPTPLASPVTQTAEPTLAQTGTPGAFWVGFAGMAAVFLGISARRIIRKK